MEWIRLEDRLPDHGQIVDIWARWTGSDGNYYGRRFIDVEYYPDLSNPWISDESSDLEGAVITHYMIATPPKDSL